jgi:hypothetical protein
MSEKNLAIENKTAAYEATRMVYKARAKGWPCWNPGRFRRTLADVESLSEDETKQLEVKTAKPN